MVEMERHTPAEWERLRAERAAGREMTERDFEMYMARQKIKHSFKSLGEARVKAAMSLSALTDPEKYQKEKKKIKTVKRWLDNIAKQSFKDYGVK